MKPIFIFSLPRSGSTLLQRIMMGHPEIKSASEPWILLPHMYALRKNGIITEYAQSSSYRALNDFISLLPNQESDYYAELRTFIERIYSSICKNNETYFLDKTPRYYMIIEEINKIFPDAKFIFLFRHPMQVINSMINTWGDGRFKSFYSVEDDITKGLSKLREGYELLSDKSFALNYDDLILDSEQTIKKIFKYLELNTKSSKEITDQISNEILKGRMGDKVGVTEYNEINRETLDKWKKHFNNYTRVWLAKYYLKRIGTNNLNCIGYDEQMLLAEINDLPKTFSSRDIVDIVDFIKVRLIKKFHLNLFFGRKTKKRIKDKYLT